MSRGGARPGSGRKPGTQNTKTQELVAKALRQGITPLEVMIEAMRFHYDAHKRALAEAIERDALRQYHAPSLDLAAAVAKDAAPFMHPRLNAIAVTGKDEGPIQVEDVSARDTLLSRISQLADRDAEEERSRVSH